MLARGPDGLSTERCETRFKMPCVTDCFGAYLTAKSNALTVAQRLAVGNIATCVNPLRHSQSAAHAIESAAAR
jgi:hypothetical protein